MTGAIAIFVKTPGLSPVKTRLAAKLGQKNAETFHIRAAQAITEVVQELGKRLPVCSYYAVAEHEALVHYYWQDLPCHWQGEGGLGERMRHIYQTLLKQHNFVVLVGADIPQMTVDELSAAAQWLNSNHQDRLAYGPSNDGGFWLFGGNCSIPANIWTDVSYSQANTGAQFLNKIKPVAQIKTFATLQDVDEVTDLPVLRHALLNSTPLSEKQQQLVHFLDNLPSLRFG